LLQGELFLSLLHLSIEVALEVEEQPFDPRYQSVTVLLFELSFLFASFPSMRPPVIVFVR
jgi:hypothetical protein